jgi:hypothetical protein
MATKTGTSDGDAEPVKYLTEVEGARRPSLLPEN